MHDNEILEDAARIERELMDEDRKKKNHDSWNINYDRNIHEGRDGSRHEAVREKMPKGPIYYIIGLLLVLMIIMMVFPYYNIRHDPAPYRMPDFEMVFPDSAIENWNYTARAGFPDPYREKVVYDDPAIKDAATRIATYSCSASGSVDSRVCHAKAIYAFVKENFAYVAETDEYVQSPKEMLFTRGGDCEDLSIMLSSLMMADGIPARLVLVPGHAYVQVYVQDALDKYKDSEGWITADPSCKNCEFGDASPDYRDSEKAFLPLY